MVLRKRSRKEFRLITGDSSTRFPATLFRGGDSATTERYSRLGAAIVEGVVKDDGNVVVDPNDGSMEITEPMESTDGPTDPSSTPFTGVAILLIRPSSRLKSLVVANPRCDGFSINARNDTLMNGEENRTGATSCVCDRSSSISTGSATSGRCVVGCSCPMATFAASSQGSAGPRNRLSMAAMAGV